MWAVKKSIGVFLCVCRGGVPSPPVSASNASGGRRDPPLLIWILDFSLLSLQAPVYSPKSKQALHKLYFCAFAELVYSFLLN